MHALVEKDRIKEIKKTPFFEKHVSRAECGPLAKRIDKRINDWIHMRSAYDNVRKSAGSTAETDISDLYSSIKKLRMSLRRAGKNPHLRARMTMLWHGESLPLSLSDGQFEIYPLLKVDDLILKPLERVMTRLAKVNKSEGRKPSRRILAPLILQLRNSIDATIEGSKRPHATVTTKDRYVCDILKLIGIVETPLRIGKIRSEFRGVALDP